MNNMTQDVAASLAMLLGVMAYIPYVRSVFHLHTKPHMFSWLVWGILPTIAFFAQDMGGAGIGGWVTAVTAFACLFIAVLAFFKGEKNITRSDWVILFSALFVIPIYFVTKDPLTAVMLVATIDTLALIPTIRKSWRNPYEEFLLTYSINGVKWILALLALEHVSLTTALYPTVLVFSNGGFALFLSLRRRALKAVI